MKNYEYYGDESLLNKKELQKTFDNARVIERSEMQNTCENFAYLIKYRNENPSAVHHYFASKYKGRLCKYFKSETNTYMWVKSNL